MTREEVISKVQKMLNKNFQIDSVFAPIIEEFFVRLEEQYNFNEQELDKRINKYNKLESINFSEGEVTKKLFMIERKSGQFEYSWRYDDIARRIKIYNEKIDVDIDFLKALLLRDKNEIERFINISFHEHGHLIQFISDNMSSTSGFNRTEFKPRIDYIEQLRSGTIVNEIAEIINAELLTKGNLERDVYSGYRRMQPISKVVFCSFGMTDKKLAELQMKGNGREDYEKYIEEKIGNDYKIPLVSMENALDTIYATSCKMMNKNFVTGKYLKQNMLVQFKPINTVSNEMIKRRIEKLGKNPNITELAQIAIDKEKRDESMLDALKQFKFQLPIGFKIDIESNIIENIVGKQVDINQLQNEIDKVQLKERTERESTINYDNCELINRMMQLAQNYDLSKLSLKNRIELIMCKHLGNIKRMITEPKVKQLPEKSSATIEEQRKKFVNRINGDNLLINNNINLTNTKIRQERKEKDEYIR